MYCYCIFCQTHKTEIIREQIINKLQISCISPKIVQRYWKQGQQKLKTHALMPGYLFLYTKEPIQSFTDIRKLYGVLKVLGDSCNGNVLMGNDLIFAESVFKMNGSIGIMKAYEEGDTVKLDNTLFEGFTGEIVRLDRRKGRAQIRFDFDGSTQFVWAAYELVKKNVHDV